MATGPTLIQTGHDGRIALYEWTLGSSEVGLPVVIPHKADKTIHVWGTFGGAVSIEGSLESDPVTATNFFVLRDAAYALISGKTALFGDQIVTHSYLLRPVAGAGVSAVTVRLLMVGGG